MKPNKPSEIKDYIDYIDAQSVPGIGMGRAQQMAEMRLTFADLAQMTPEAIRGIGKSFQNIGNQRALDLIEQAKLINTSYQDYKQTRNFGELVQKTPSTIMDEKQLAREGVRWLDKEAVPQTQQESRIKFKNASDLAIPLDKMGVGDFNRKSILENSTTPNQLLGVIQAAWASRMKAGAGLYKDESTSARRQRELAGADPKKGSKSLKNSNMSQFQERVSKEEREKGISAFTPYLHTNKDTGESSIRVTLPSTFGRMNKDETKVYDIKVSQDGVIMIFDIEKPNQGYAIGTGTSVLYDTSQKNNPITGQKTSAQGKDIVGYDTISPVESLYQLVAGVYNLPTSGNDGLNEDGKSALSIDRDQGLSNLRKSYLEQNPDAKLTGTTAFNIQSLNIKSTSNFAANKMKYAIANPADPSGFGSVTDYQDQTAFAKFASKFLPQSQGGGERGERHLDGELANFEYIAYKGAGLTDVIGWLHETGRVAFDEEGNPYLVGSRHKGLKSIDQGTSARRQLSRVTRGIGGEEVGNELANAVFAEDQDRGVRVNATYIDDSTWIGDGASYWNVDNKPDYAWNEKTVLIPEGSDISQLQKGQVFSNKNVPYTFVAQGDNIQYRGNDTEHQNWSMIERAMGNYDHAIYTGTRKETVYLPDAFGNRMEVTREVAVFDVGHNVSEFEIKDRATKHMAIAVEGSKNKMFQSVLDSTGTNTDVILPTSKDMKAVALGALQAADQDVIQEYLGRVYDNPTDLYDMVIDPETGHEYMQMKKGSKVRDAFAMAAELFLADSRVDIEIKDSAVEMTGVGSMIKQHNTQVMDSLKAAGLTEGQLQEMITSEKVDLTEYMQAQYNSDLFVDARDNVFGGNSEVALNFLEAWDEAGYSEEFAENWVETHYDWNEFAGHDVADKKIFALGEVMGLMDRRDDYVRKLSEEYINDIWNGQDTILQMTPEAKSLLEERGITEGTGFIQSLRFDGFTAVMDRTTKGYQFDIHHGIQTNASSGKMKISADALTNLKVRHPELYERISDDIRGGAYRGSDKFSIIQSYMANVDEGMAIDTDSDAIRVSEKSVYGNEKTQFAEKYRETFESVMAELYNRDQPIGQQQRDTAVYETMKRMSKNKEYAGRVMKFENDYIPSIDAIYNELEIDNDGRIKSNHMSQLVDLIHAQATTAGGVSEAVADDKLSEYQRIQRLKLSNAKYIDSIFSVHESAGTGKSRGLPFGGRVGFMQEAQLDSLIDENKALSKREKEVAKRLARSKFGVAAMTQRHPVSNPNRASGESIMLTHGQLGEAFDGILPQTRTPMIDSTFAYEGGGDVDGDTYLMMLLGHALQMGSPVERLKKIAQNPAGEMQDNIERAAKGFDNSLMLKVDPNETLADYRNRVIESGKGAFSMAEVDSAYYKESYSNAMMGLEYNKYVRKGKLLTRGIAGLGHGDSERDEAVGLLGAGMYQMALDKSASIDPANRQMNNMFLHFNGDDLDERLKSYQRFEPKINNQEVKNNSSVFISGGQEYRFWDANASEDRIKEILRERLGALKEKGLENVIVGDANGVDLWASEIADDLGLRIVQYIAGKGKKGEVRDIETNPKAGRNGFEPKNENTKFHQRVVGGDYTARDEVMSTIANDNSFLQMMFPSRRPKSGKLTGTEKNYARAKHGLTEVYHTDKTESPFRKVSVDNAVVDSILAFDEGDSVESRKDALARDWMFNSLRYGLSHNDKQVRIDENDSSSYEPYEKQARLVAEMIVPASQKQNVDKVARRIFDNWVRMTTPKDGESESLYDRIRKYENEIETYYQHGIDNNGLSPVEMEDLKSTTQKLLSARNEAFDTQRILQYIGAESEMDWLRGGESVGNLSAFAGMGIMTTGVGILKDHEDRLKQAAGDDPRKLTEVEQLITNVQNAFTLAKQLAGTGEFTSIEDMMDVASVSAHMGIEEGYAPFQEAMGYISSEEMFRKTMPKSMFESMRGDISNVEGIDTRMLDMLQREVMSDRPKMIGAQQEEYAKFLIQRRKDISQGELTRKEIDAIRHLSTKSQNETTDHGSMLEDLFQYFRDDSQLNTYRREMEDAKKRGQEYTARYRSNVVSEGGNSTVHEEKVNSLRDSLIKAMGEDNFNLLEKGFRNGKFGNITDLRDFYYSMRTIINPGKINNLANVREGQKEYYGYFQMNGPDKMYKEWVQSQYVQYIKHHAKEKGLEIERDGNNNPYIKDDKARREIATSFIPYIQQQARTNFFDKQRGNELYTQFGKSFLGNSRKEIVQARKKFNISAKDAEKVAEREINRLKQFSTVARKSQNGADYFQSLVHDFATRQTEAYEVARPKIFNMFSDLLNESGLFNSDGTIESSIGKVNEFAINEATLAFSELAVDEIEEFGLEKFNERHANDKKEQRVEVSSDYLTPALADDGKLLLPSEDNWRKYISDVKQNEDMMSRIKDGKEFKTEAELNRAIVTDAIRHELIHSRQNKSGIEPQNNPSWTDASGIVQTATGVASRIEGATVSDDGVINIPGTPARSGPFSKPQSIQPAPFKKPDIPKPAQALTDNAFKWLEEEGFLDEDDHFYNYVLEHADRTKADNVGLNEARRLVGQRSGFFDWRKKQGYTGWESFRQYRDEHEDKLDWFTASKSDPNDPNKNQPDEQEARMPDPDDIASSLGEPQGFPFGTKKDEGPTFTYNPTNPLSSRQSTENFIAAIASETGLTSDEVSSKLLGHYGKNKFSEIGKVSMDEVMAIPSFAEAKVEKGMFKGTADSPVSTPTPIAKAKPKKRSLDVSGLSVSQLKELQNRRHSLQEAEDVFSSLTNNSVGDVLQIADETNAFLNSDTSKIVEKADGIASSIDDMPKDIQERFLDNLHVADALSASEGQEIEKDKVLAMQALQVMQNDQEETRLRQQTIFNKGGVKKQPPVNKFNAIKVLATNKTLSSIGSDILADPSLALDVNTVESFSRAFGSREHQSFMNTGKLAQEYMMDHANSSLPRGALLAQAWGVDSDTAEMYQRQFESMESMLKKIETQSTKGESSLLEKMSDTLTKASLEDIDSRGRVGEGGTPNIEGAISGLETLQGTIDELGSLSSMTAEQTMKYAGAINQVRGVHEAALQSIKEYESIQAQGKGIGGEQRARLEASTDEKDIQELERIRRIEANAEAAKKALADTSSGIGMYNQKKKELDKMLSEVSTMSQSESFRKELAMRSVSEKDVGALLQTGYTAQRFNEESKLPGSLSSADFANTLESLLSKGGIQSLVERADLARKRMDEDSSMSLKSAWGAETDRVAEQLQSLEDNGVIASARELLETNAEHAPELAARRSESQSQRYLEAKLKTETFDTRKSGRMEVLAESDGKLKDGVESLLALSSEFSDLNNISKDMIPKMKDYANAVNTMSQLYIEANEIIASHKQRTSDTGDLSKSAIAAAEATIKSDTATPEQIESAKEKLRVNSVLEEAKNNAEKALSEGALASYSENRSQHEKTLAAINTQQAALGRETMSKEEREAALWQVLMAGGPSGKTQRQRNLSKLIEDSEEEGDKGGLELFGGVNVGGHQLINGVNIKNEKALEAIGEAGRTIRAVPAAFHSYLMAQNEIITPVLQMMGQYENQQRQVADSFRSSGFYGQFDYDTSEFKEVMQTSSQVANAKMGFSEGLYESLAPIIKTLAPDKETAKNASGMAVMGGMGLTGLMVGSRFGVQGGVVGGLGGLLAGGATTLGSENYNKSGMLGATSLTGLYAGTKTLAPFFGVTGLAGAAIGLGIGGTLAMGAQAYNASQNVGSEYLDRAQAVAQFHDGREGLSGFGRAFYNTKGTLGYLWNETAYQLGASTNGNRRDQEMEARTGVMLGNLSSVYSANSTEDIESALDKYNAAMENYSYTTGEGSASVHRLDTDFIQQAFNEGYRDSDAIVQGMIYQEAEAQDSVLAAKAYFNENNGILGRDYEIDPEFELQDWQREELDSVENIGEYISTMENAAKQARDVADSIQSAQNEYGHLQVDTMGMINNLASELSTESGLYETEEQAKASLAPLFGQITTNESLDQIRSRANKVVELEKSGIGASQIREMASVVAASRGENQYDEETLLSIASELIDTLYDAEGNKSNLTQEQLNTAQRNMQVNEQFALGGLTDLTRDENYYSEKGFSDFQKNAADQNAMMRGQIAGQSDALYAVSEEQFDRLDELIANDDLKGYTRESFRLQSAMGAYNQFAPYQTQDQLSQTFRSTLSLTRNMSQEEMSRMQAIQSGDQYAMSLASGNSPAGWKILGDIKYQTIDETGQNNLIENISDAEYQSMLADDKYGMINLTEEERKMGIRGIQNKLRLGEIDMMERQFEQTNMQMALGREMQAGVSSSGGVTFDSKGFVVSLDGPTMNKFESMYKKYGLGDYQRTRSQLELEDLSTKLQRTQQDFDIKMQGEGLALNKAGLSLQQQQFGEQIAMQLKQMGIGEYFQTEQLGLSKERAAKQIQWQREDLAFENSQTDVGFSFQMAELDSQLRYTRGRERRQLMRQQEQAVVMYSMQKGQLGVQEGRLDTQEGWMEEDFAMQEEQLRVNIELQRESIALQTKHFGENMSLQQAQFALEMERYESSISFMMNQRAIEDESRLLQRQNAEIQFAMQEEMNKLTQEYQRDVKRLSDSLSGANGYNERRVALIQLEIATGAIHNSVIERMLELYPELDTAMITNSKNAAISVNNLFSSIGNSMKAMIDTATAVDKSKPVPKAGYYGPGFSSGGYTGSGASDEVAGVVHRNEYVVPENGALVVKGTDEEVNRRLDKIATLLEQIVAMGPGRVNANITMPNGQNVSTRNILDILSSEM